MGSIFIYSTQCRASLLTGKFGLPDFNSERIFDLLERVSVPAYPMIKEENYRLIRIISVQVRVRL